MTRPASSYRESHEDHSYQQGRSVRRKQIPPSFFESSSAERFVQREAVPEASFPVVLNSILNPPAIDPALLSTLPFPSAGLSTQPPNSSAIPAVQFVPPVNPLNSFSSIPWLNSVNNPYLLTAMGLQFSTIPFPYLPSTSFAQHIPTSSIFPYSQLTQAEDSVKTADIDKVIKEEVSV
ncbi:hypothetical protein L3Y34_003436 [Caenorhabditis briggsae]|uniref:Uncharacterized protein n=1 Tax=Caenorhabditis briggsae TaxID=6238 RepID=A0AAE9ACP7_CAEBR|nr:hypothetical protein L3Y34_003436 [Caenorhabditis briggsae]